MQWDCEILLMYHKKENLLLGKCKKTEAIFLAIQEKHKPIDQRRGWFLVRSALIFLANCAHNVGGNWKAPPSPGGRERRGKNQVSKKDFRNRKSVFIPCRFLNSLFPPLRQTLLMNFPDSLSGHGA